MAWALVKWVTEDRVSVISTNWIVEPKNLDIDMMLPVKGFCYWKKTVKYDTEILEISDDKNELQEKIGKYCNTADDESPDEHEADDETDVRTRKNKRKAETEVNKDIKKAKKIAEIAASHEMAKQIFSHQSQASCSLCRKLKEEIQKKDHLISELENGIKDLKQTSKEKDHVIEELKDNLKRTRTSDTSRSQTSMPKPDRATIQYLTEMVRFYSTPPDNGSHLGFPEIDNDSEFFGSDVEELEDDKIFTPSSAARPRPTQAVNPKQGNKTPQTSTPVSRYSSTSTKPCVKPILPAPVKQEVDKRCLESINMTSTDMPVLKSGKYEYQLTPDDLKTEQDAFQPGEGKKELVEGYGVYVRFVELEQAEQSSKNSATGLMRALIGLWYSRQRLAGSSATSGINKAIRTAVFKYCELKYTQGASADKLKRDLTSKCGEDRRRMLKDMIQ